MTTGPSWIHPQTNKDSCHDIFYKAWSNLIVTRPERWNAIKLCDAVAGPFNAPSQHGLGIGLVPRVTAENFSSPHRGLVSPAPSRPSDGAGLARSDGSDDVGSRAFDAS
ncbi:hypothetical protein NL676_004669 [Syzygium grande]|nr:hypothetical protein NL676_004669 [Syzygium grande]